MFLLPGKAWTQLWNFLFSRWLSSISKSGDMIPFHRMLILSIDQSLSWVNCQSWVNLPLLQEEFDSSDQSAKGQKTALEAVVGETFWYRRYIRLSINFISIHSYIEPVLHPGGSESINLGLVQGLGALSLHGVSFICVGKKVTKQDHLRWM